MDDPSTLETLQAKVLLLLRHEHELYLMRKAKRRLAQWLESYRELSSELRDIDAPALIRRWAELHVTRLHFEIAGAIEYELDTGAVTFAWMDPSATTRSVIPAEACAFFASQPAGVCRDDGVARAFGSTIGLHAFFWNWSRARSGRAILAVAGCSQAGAPFNAPAEDDRGMFGMLANHLAALLANSALVAEVTRDRAELQCANAELDASLHHLADAQRRLIESSRLAGMADIAIAVLHNVGNVLNSVNVSVETLVAHTTNLRVGRLVEAADVIEHGDPERRGKGIAYLRSVASVLGTDRTGILRELHALRDHVDHIKTIVSRQQAFATVRCVVEPCQVNALIEDALLMSHAAMIQHGVDVIRDYHETPPVTLDRHRVLQILINLISNARQSVVEAGRVSKRITVRSRPADHARIRIEIEDNGLGIAQEHHARVFSHGFTTKSGGHGIGLHSSALAASELHGTLTFTSDGLDRGATFALELPLVPG